MENWIAAESFGHSFFYAFPICLIVLFALLKGRRLRFLVPGLVITLVIVNPLFYKYWEELGLYAYWRILWIVPVLPVPNDIPIPLRPDAYNSGKVVETLPSFLPIVKLYDDTTKTIISK